MLISLRPWLRAKRWKATRVRTYFSHTLSFAFLICLSCSGFRAGAAIGHDSDGPRVDLPENRHDFGDVFKGESISHTFQIRNTGTAVLQLSDTPPPQPKKKPAAALRTPAQLQAVSFGRPAGFGFVAPISGPLPEAPAAPLFAAPSWCMGTDVYFDRSLQPGQVGVIRIVMQTTAESGKVQRDYRLFTNDPAQPAITLTLACTVNPVPAWMSRLQNPNLLFGSRVGNFTVWPTAEPQLRIARGEPFQLMLRVTPAGPDSVSPAEPASNATPGNTPGNGNDNAGRADKVVPLPTDKIAYKTVDISEGAPGGFWLAIDIGPVDDPGLFSYNLTIPDRHGKPVDVSVRIGVQVIDDQFVISPDSVELGEVKISAMAGDDTELGRFGLRRVLRSFEMKELSCSLPFLKVSTQPIVNGRNYFVTLSPAPSAKPPRPGSYEGKVRIVTGDNQHPVIEVPVKVKLVR